ncbi:hypothetical protein [Segatella copri]|uniref:hypothetical protein n=1 Tax=Segatella copri TaxID=165179 RepID=UPI001290D0F1|nr:hypothetical protein [Segatella copri]MQM89148.1 hypothetical protein [Segatella copri]MQM96912.1 hypothetical protein [Segatella copri]MQN04205.1 hypothetical protein [Segatella copri]MQN17425.1 hypothetical protein [Segatella copri]MQO37189.1 hypothetical protein [Segatella copri]
MEIVEQFPCEALDKIFKKLAEYADSKPLTKEEQEKYDNSMMVMWDNYAVYKYAVEKAYKKGYEEGYKIGYEEGKRKASKEFALKLLAHNYPLEEIADLTDLSIEEIKKLEQ